METVVSCVPMKQVQGKNGPATVYAIGLSDGQGGESFAVQIPVGTPVSDLTIEATQYGNRIKLKKSAGTWGGGGQKRGGNESFALAYAKDLVVAGKVDIKAILPTADKLYNWLESKKDGVPVAQATTVNTTTQATAHKPVIEPIDDLPF